MTDSRLGRRIGPAGAVAVGLSAMLGAGVFVVWSPAAAAAGDWMLWGLLLAGLVAWANAETTVRLAARWPVSGGAYAYGRAAVSPAVGALAGYAFVLGKSASAGAAALTVGTYLAPDQARLVGVAAVLVVLALDLSGVVRTVRAAAILAAIVFFVLALVVVAGWSGNPSPEPVSEEPGWQGVLTAAGFCFFAFAGYARLATLGEEVRDPQRTIPAAARVALAIAFAIYLAVGATVLHVLGAGGAAETEAPLNATAEAVGADWLLPVLAVGAAVAAGAALLSLVSGMSRTTFAMAANGDAPRRLSHVSARAVPAAASIAIAAVVVLVVLGGGITAAVGVSATAVLLYYAVAHVSLLVTRPSPPRTAVAVFGLVACLVIAGSLPATAVLATLLLLATALIVRAIVLRRA